MEWQRPLAYAYSTRLAETPADSVTQVPFLSFPVAHELRAILE